MSAYIHCTMGQAGVWRNLFKTLGQTPLTIELPGHGHAPAWDRTADYLLQARDLVMDQIQDPQHIVGHSYGAVVAMLVAVDYPHLVRSLTLIEPPFVKAAVETNATAVDAYAAEFRAFRMAMDVGDKALGAELFSDFWGGLPWAAMRPEQQSYIEERVDIILATEAGLTQDTADIWPRLSTLSIPTLLLEGANSPAIMTSIQAGLTRQIPSAERQVIEGADHMGPIVNPAPYAAAISAFQQSY